MRRQTGFTTFTVTLLLLVILVSLSLLVAKVMFSDRRVSLSEIQYRQAFSLAEQGLSDALGRLAQDLSWRTTATQVTTSEGSYQLNVSDQTPITVGSQTITPVRLTASASLAGSSAQAQVQVSAVAVSLLAGSPAAPLTVAGGMAVSGNFSVVANPNGGGLGVPLSIWTSDYLDMNNGSGQTCHLGDYSGGCASYISSKGNKQSDIKDSDPDFPGDLVNYLFNEPDTAAGWANLEARAAQMLTNCSSLNAQSRGLIIVDGDCKPSSNIGTIAAPVVLIVRNGNLTINGASVLNGLVFAYASNPASATTDISLKGGALVNGALVANYRLGKTANGTFDAKYDQSVLDNIQTGSTFQTLSLIPGSWQDW
ncbi:MAG: hypothetical protein ACRCYV_02960 [Aeromonas sp.]